MSNSDFMQMCSKQTGEYKWAYRPWMQWTLREDLVDVIMNQLRAIIKGQFLAGTNGTNFGPGI